MQNKNLISIIIPFYNIGDCIKNTIDSLESQIYRQFEVIFVNDASTDNSLEIVKDYLKSVSFNYNIINRVKNGGPSPSRNMGLKEARGELIYFLDSDDCIYEDTLKKVTEFFTSENPDMIFFQFKRVDENGSVTQYYTDIFEDVNKIESSRDILIKYINLDIFLYTCSVVYKKGLIKNIYFNENNDTHYYIEDQDFTIRALLNADKVGYINSELIQYYKRKGSIMNSKFNLRRLNKVTLFDTFYCKYRESDKELSSLFSKRRAKEVLWVIRTYIKNENELNVKQIKNYIKENILTEGVRPYLNREYLKELNIKNIFQIFLLLNFPGLFIRLVKLL